MTNDRREGRRLPLDGEPGSGPVDDRVADLEARLAQLESNPTMRSRGRSFVQWLMPGEAAQHFRNAGREQLLGVRSIVDYWIGRIDRMEEQQPDAPERETIEIR
jgi:hypothetical protein